jgi:aminoglycoside phosphotransferase (APT) family kinase protein
MDPVDVLLAAHGCAAPWVALEATGLANRIYATDAVVLRVATNHPDAVPDARTESVAAPAARAAGIRTPRLLAFDDSRVLIDRPFTLWERVHGLTLGRTALPVRQREQVWHDIGRELARLHDAIRVCPDPQGYLDTPGYEPDLEPVVDRLVSAGAAPPAVTREIRVLLERLAPHVRAGSQSRCFVHNDLHEMNVMCSPDGRLLALLDWGDAGWGDPVLDFVAVPLDLLPAALAGYGEANRARLGPFPEARIAWARLHDAMDAAIDAPGTPIPLAEIRAMARA